MPEGIVAEPGVLHGLDVSHHQGTIDWLAVAKAGMRFAYAKATDGVSFVDPMFATNWAAMKAAGIPRGAYHFFRPAHGLEAQVNSFVTGVKTLSGDDLPPMLDVEEAPTSEGADEWLQVAATERVPLVIHMLETLRERLGRKPILYTRRGFVQQTLPAAGPLGQFPLWIAHFTTNAEPAMPSMWGRWTLWQFSETGTVPGIQGHVDLDRFNGSADGLAGLAAPEG